MVSEPITAQYLGHVLHTDNHSSAYMIFISFKTAFDSIHRGKIMEILSEYGIPQNIVDVINLMYCNTKAIYEYFHRQSPGNNQIQHKTLKINQFKNIRNHMKTYQTYTKHQKPHKTRPKCKTNPYKIIQYSNM